MGEKALELLKRMAKAKDEKGICFFDNFFYYDVPEVVLEALDCGGYIERNNDIAASIALTEKGYAKAKS